jgi:aryl-alcohol dehydrogenase-like predicted oxidoreductase
MTFGEDLDPSAGSSVEDSEAILARYLEQGGNFIDTANIYTRGHSEKTSATSSIRAKASAIVW